MPQVSRRLFTVVFQFLASLCEIYGGHSVTGTSLYPSTSLTLSVSFYQGCISVLFYRVFLPGGQGNEGWDVQINNALSGIGENWMEF
jgi:hypothetical protein